MRIVLSNRISKGHEMVKKILMLSLIGATVSVWAAMNKMQEVDATSTATVHNIVKFSVPLNVASDSAIFKWRDSLNRTGSTSATVTLSFGKTEATMTSKTVTPKKLENKVYSVNLTGLETKTTYKIRLEVSQASGAHKPCADTTTITTLATTSAELHFNPAKEVPLELLDHSVRLGSAAKSNDHLIIADCQGRTVLDHHVKGCEKSINLPSKAKGVYFMTYTREGKILDKKQFVITHK
jgi:hypothetical protein